MKCPVGRSWLNHLYRGREARSDARRHCGTGTAPDETLTVTASSTVAVVTSEA